MSLKKHNYDQPLPQNKYNPLSWIQPEAKIGANCWIGAFCFIADNVKIGDNVSIANGVQIFDHDTSWYRATHGKADVENYEAVIENDVEIGANSVIIGDVTIGHNSIVGAMSLVKKDIPPFSVVAGVPAKMLMPQSIRLMHIMR